MVIIKTYGRTTIYANYTEQELLSGTEEEREAKVLDIINNSIGIHEKNSAESKYLIDYLYGIQDIYIEKQKFTRPEINNMTVENWAYAFVDFKKTWLLGKPIQYVQLSGENGNEISILNKYCRYEGKKAKDMQAYEYILACGRAFRYTNIKPSTDMQGEEEEAPFELLNAPIADTEVVYSSKLGNEQLLSYIQTSMMYIKQEVNPITGKIDNVQVPYTEYTVYTKNRVYVINDKSGNLTVTETKPLFVNEHIITEYYMNEKRISMIEIGKDLFNDINYLESMDKDDMEQFVNAIMIFKNTEIDENELEAGKELGAIQISSSEGRDADVFLLQERLKAQDTQTYYTRLLTSLHQILGIPMAGDSGTVTSGDTGEAKLTGQGFTSAGIRAEGDETMFGMCDMKALKKVIKICKMSPKSDIKDLKSSEIDTKFQRDMSDNLLVKTQGLMNLYSCDIPREIANAIVGLFPDSNAVTKLQDEKFGEQTSKTNTNTNNTNIEIQKQNNDIQDTTQNDLQKK